jgi:hypothetical protein
LIKLRWNDDIFRALAEFFLSVFEGTLFFKHVLSGQVKNLNMTVIP